MTIPMPGAGSLTAHRLRLAVAVLWLAAILVALAVAGADYYTLGLAERIRSPKHAMLRSSGTVGIRVGMLGAFMFCCLYGYAIRKKWKWLGRIGKTKNWLDFHVVAGVAAPMLITFHSAFKFQGLAGVAYWIMMAVMLSGFVGRYLYARIPRSLSAAELSLKEILALRDELAADLASQEMLDPSLLARLYHAPDRAAVQSMPLWRAALAMVRLDLARPFHIAALRREALPPARRLWALMGFLPSNNTAMERVISLARKHAGLQVKLLFLDRAHEVFHLWHVVHRPFSYSLAVIMTLHIAVVLLLGYY